MSQPPTASTVNVHEAKTHFSKLLERAHNGEEIILAKAGKPYARLVPLPAPRKRELGFLSGRVRLSDAENDELLRPLTDEEVTDWEGDETHPASVQKQ